MTETITIDGKDYEVLTLDRIGEITHAKLAGGKVTTARPDGGIVLVTSPIDPVFAENEYHRDELEDFGIQPLKLIERVPVEFHARVLNDSGEGIIRVPSGIPFGMKFRCTEITEGAWA